MTDAESTGDYWGRAQELDHSDYWDVAKQSHFRRCLAYLDGRLDAGSRRIADFGGGVGVFCRLALDEGWESTLVEVSPIARDSAKDRLPESQIISPGSVHEAAYDAVTLWCVVAHTIDPSGLVREVYRALRPGGILWLTTPNFSFQQHYASLRARFGQEVKFADRDHWVNFTPEGIRLLLETNQFADLDWVNLGTTEYCCGLTSARKSLVAAKRVWNAAAYGLLKMTGRNAMSVLQVAATKRR